MNSKILHSSAVLKLNSCWQGLGYVTPKEAFTKMFNNSDDRLNGLDIVLNNDGSISNQSRTYTGSEWMELPVRSTDITIGLAHGRRVRVPLAVIVPDFFILPKVRLQFSKRGLYCRDRGRCGYCDAVLTYDESTKDHVIPASRGGTTSWSNCVLSCEPCNFFKADRTPAEAGMVLRRNVRIPGETPVLVEVRHDSPREHRALLHAA